MNYLSDYVDYLKGRKTYILGIFAIIYGITGYYIGQLDSTIAFQFIWGGFTAMTLRGGIAGIAN